MSEQTPPLITIFKSWKSYQQRLVEIIAPLTPEQLASPVPVHQWTIGMIAQHIVANRVWWFQVWMGEGSPELAPIAHWDPQDEEEQFTIEAAELVTGLEATWKMIADALTRWTLADLEYLIPTPDRLGEEERKNFPPRTREWIMWHVLKHEIHHGGELSLALGMYGLEGIYG